MASKGEGKKEEFEVEEAEPEAAKAEQGKKKGFFGGLGAKLDKVGKDIGKGMDSAAASIEKTVDEKWKSALLENFKSGCRVQLISRSSGKPLQYLNGTLNGLGTEGSGDENKASFWTVINDGNNIIRLNIDNNYLAIDDGTTCVKHYSDPSMTGPETKFRLQQSGQFVMLVSVKEANRHAAVLPDGSIKSALISAKEQDSQFGVRLIYSPYPPKENK